MHKTVFFDLGNVLVFFNHERMCRQIGAYCGLKEEAVRKMLFEDGIGSAYERGEIDSTQLHDHFVQLAGKPLDCKGLIKAASDIFEFNTSIEPIVKKLKAKAIRLYILSNTCEAHFNFAYKRYPLLRLFDGYVLSYKVKAAKPDQKIYEQAVALANCAKEECFFTDDVEEHVLSARRFGMDSELFTSAHDLTTHLTQRSLL